MTAPIAPPREGLEILAKPALKCRALFRQRLSRTASSIIALLLAPTSALAQPESYNVSLPSETKAVNEAGVDMRSGQYQYSETDLSIGGDGGLDLERTPAKYLYERFNPFGNFAHNWDIFLTEHVTSATIEDKGVALVNFGRYPVQSSAATVYFGTRSERFTAFGTETVYLPSAKIAASGKLTYSGNRTTASALYKYESNDGTAIEFRAIGSKDCASSSRRCAFATKVVLPDGTEFALAYDAAVPGAQNSARLRSVTSSRGYALLFEYGGPANMQVTKACTLNIALTPKPVTNACPAGAPQTTSYTYTSFAGRTKLASVVAPDGATSSFAYAAKTGLPVLAGSVPDTQAVEMSYFKPGITPAWYVQVTSPYARNGSQDFDEVTRSQHFSDGRSYSYAYFFARGLSIEHDPVIAGGTFTNNRGDVVDYGYSVITYPGFYHPLPPAGGELFGNPVSLTLLQTTPGPTMIRDELGRITSLSYCDQYYRPGSVPGSPGTPWPFGDCVVQPLPLSVTSPGGGTVKYVYDGIGSVLEQRKIAKEGSGLPDQVVTMQYGCAPRKCWTKPTSVTDPNGHVTTYSYSTDHGGILTETRPPVGGVAPQKRYEYAQRYAWIRNAADTAYVQAATPIWLLMRERSCIAGAASGAGCAGGALDEVVVDYYGPSGGPNNLLLRGKAVTAANALGVLETQRSCYGYDASGRQISETQPLANLATCP